MQMTTLEKVRAVILKLKKKNITEADLKPEARMVEDLKLDSIDMAELLVLTEEAFGLKISDDDVKKMSTIAAADGLGMPVSTTHVLNSAVAGTMVANKSGLNFATVKTILSAWIFTLPATITISGGLYWLFLQFVS